MSWFVARLRDDVERGPQTGALAHRFEWLSVELAASGEDTAGIALFATRRADAAGGLGPEVYLTPACGPYLRRLLADLESAACEPPPPERLVLLGGDAAWYGGLLEPPRQRAS